MLSGSGISGVAAQRVLAQLQIVPVLVDVGASGAPPPLWNPIAAHATYIGFDPDQRDTHELTSGRFRRTVMVNQAITADKGRTSLPFFLTSSPHCSSTLAPDTVALQDYLFANLFAVEREAAMPATTLNAVIERLELPGIDWLKLDTQGTDLRIFNSLEPSWRSRVLAIDIEPGLMDAYVGEDMFIDVHRSLSEQGFWLSNLKIMGAARLRRTTLDRILASRPDLSERLITHAVRPSPGWCEARYLRTAAWLAEHDAPPRDYQLHWLFAMLDRQPGFALDLGIAYEERFGQSSVTSFLQAYPLSAIRRASGWRLLKLTRQKLSAVVHGVQKFVSTGR